MATKKFNIEAPAEGFTGISFGVPFLQGKGQTDDPWLVQRFKESGYKVTEDGTPEDVKPEDKGDDKNLTGLGYEELKAKAKGLGLEFPGNISGDNLKAMLKELGYEA